MFYMSHRGRGGRRFNCLFEPLDTVSSEKDEQRSSSTKLSPTQSDLLTNIGNSECLTTKCRRLEGGASNTTPCKLKRPKAPLTECKGKDRNLFFFQPSTNVNIINVKLSDSKTNTKLVNRAECKLFGDGKKRQIIKTRGTQTLYRESSAQTLPYLPGVSNEEEELENLELFKLPTILPGDGPPGLYEVEILERARKRWAFTRALKENFRQQLNESKENKQIPPKKHILEAFEWEHWIEREEYIQECQMLRLELVIRMFEKREKEIHQASRTRIEMSCDKIAAKREADLRKNDTEYRRHMRRLEIKRLNQPRNWRKENIASQLGDPSSEFYAPQMRYGVNPNRRHFKAERIAFESRMDELEKKAVNMKKLVCPFAKLKEWSKPKGRLTEVEQNFCSGENLKKLYESLKGLRKQSTKLKILPKCLKEKSPKEIVVEAKPDIDIYDEILIFEDNSSSTEHDQSVLDEIRKAKEDEEFRRQVAWQKQRAQQLLSESRKEELEALLAEYEGSTIGWLMKFLSDEMIRLQEQRKLHFLTMLAQKERWRREAAEAGLRQKENDMREIYEQLFQQTNQANIEVTSEYLQNILDVDTREQADEEATNNITALARIIDTDIQRWLDSFRSIQTPLNYQMLRYILKDLIFPNLDVLLKRYESELVVEGIIHDDLFPRIEKLLEPYDISFTIASDLVDRLIDNDVHLFSDDSCSSSDCSVQQLEARAILRKLIRRSVPGRRWMTPSERAADEYVNDIFDEVFNEIKKIECAKLNFELREQESHINLPIDKDTIKTPYSESDSEELTQFINSNYFMSHKDSIKSLREIPSQFDMLSRQGLQMDNAESSSDISDIGIIFDRASLVQWHESTKEFIKDLIYEILDDFLPYEEIHDEEGNECMGETDYDVNIEEELDECPQKIINCILKGVIKSIVSDESFETTSFENQLVDVEIEEMVDEEDDEYMLVINESEILDLLDTVKCKCKSEMEKEALVRKLLKQGKVKIIKKKKHMEEGEEEDGGYEDDATLLGLSLQTFEYDEDADIQEMPVTGNVPVKKTQFSDNVVDKDLQEPAVNMDTEPDSALANISEKVAELVDLENAVESTPTDATKENDEQILLENVAIEADIVDSENLADTTQAVGTELKNQPEGEEEVQPMQAVSGVTENIESTGNADVIDVNVGVQQADVVENIATIEVEIVEIAGAGAADNIMPVDAIKNAETNMPETVTAENDPMKEAEVQ